MVKNTYLLWIIISLPLCVITTSCNNETPQVSQQKKIDNKNLITEGTSEMIAELAKIAKDTSDFQAWHQNGLRAKKYDELAKKSQDPSQRISALFKSGMEWLNDGKYETAINRFKSIKSYISQNKISINEESLLKMEEILGMAYLRKAEIENCVNNHNEYSCIFPIVGKGKHAITDGSEMALTVFEEILVKQPENIQVKWLLNIAQMTLGGYPNKIDASNLINPSLFESDTVIPRFTDMAMNFGIAVNDISGSVIMDDFNNDHYLDLMVSSYGVDDQLRYFQNNKKNGFDDKTIESGIKGLLSGLNMIQADYDNDGWLDVLILRGAWLGKSGKHPNSLLRNNGDGTFSDVTKSTGLYCHYPTQTASWADYNNDGWIDLFIANEHSSNVDAPCQLFENNGDGTFKNVAKEKGLNVRGFFKGCVWGDYNNDGNSDLYLSSINGNNYLFKNNGTSSAFNFTDVAIKAKCNNPLFSFPCWFFDYNQDGWEDIFVSGFNFKQFETAAGEVAKDYLGMPFQAELPKVYKNRKDGTFEDVTKETGLETALFTMGSNFGDLNNDGYFDFYTATGTPDFRALIPNRMFLNDKGQRFLDVTKSGGFGHLQKGHGVSFGDFDMDGDQDIYHVLGGSYDGDNFMNALFVNPGNQNNWIKLKLEGHLSNKSAIGSRLKIFAINNNGNQKIFYNSVNSGGSFGANTLIVEQGLGKCNIIEKIEIQWAGQKGIQIISKIKPNKFYIINEGHDVTEQVDLKPLTFNSTLARHLHH